MDWKSEPVVPGWHWVLYLDGGMGCVDVDQEDIDDGVGCLWAQRRVRLWWGPVEAPVAPEEVWDGLDE